MKYLSLVFVLALALVGCNGEPPVEPPPEGCQLGPDDCSYGVDEELCECLPKPYPEPPVEPPVEPPSHPCENIDELRECGFGFYRLKCECKPDPSDKPNAADPMDYFRIEVVESKLFWQSHEWEGLFAYSQALAWPGTRDFNSVVRNCSEWGSALLGSNDKEFGELADVGKALWVENGHFIRGFWIRKDPTNPRDLSGVPRPNRRCDPESGVFDEAFLNANGECARSWVHKETFNEYKGRLLDHMGEVRVYRARAGQCRTNNSSAPEEPNYMKSYDSIAGWCSAMNATGRTTCP